MSLVLSFTQLPLKVEMRLVVSSYHEETTGLLAFWPPAYSTQHVASFLEIMTIWLGPDAR